MSAKLLVVGSLHLDVVVRAPHLPALDETVMGSDVAYVFGGKGGNQAVAAARMGADVAFAGRIGRDQFGTLLRGTLAAQQIDCTLLQEDGGASGMSTAIIDAQGEYGAVVVSAANQNINPDEIDVADNVGMVLLQNEVPTAVNLAVAQRAKAAGAQVWLNAAPARPLSDALIACLDLVIVNRVEAAFYGGSLDNLQVLRTLGPDGVQFAGQTFPGFSVAPHSTHGAGDMFVGALAASVLKDAEMEAAIEFAQAAAALHVASDQAARDELNAERVSQFQATQSSR